MTLMMKILMLSNFAESFPSIESAVKRYLKLHCNS